MNFLGKQNRDGSYSISVKARELVEAGWVDFYAEGSGRGYQRRETMRETRAREIEEYFKRCAAEDLDPHLFEMTASARCERDGGEVRVSFDPLDEDERLGFVTVTASSQPWMSMVDGGTRLRGIERAVSSGTLPGETFFDVRLFGDLSVPEEIALFLLINENQKRVRTDLSLRVVQRSLDQGALTDAQLRTLRTVVPNTEQWRYEASRVTARINSEPDSRSEDSCKCPERQPQAHPSPCRRSGRVLGTCWMTRISPRGLKGIDDILNATEFWVKVLKNFWGAVAEVNRAARAEPKTNVLWGSIGVNGCHRALAGIVRSELSAKQIDLSRDRFVTMVIHTWIADYAIWFSRKGSRLPEYPGEKGEATAMTGNSGYIRLAEILERQWRANLHAAGVAKSREPLVLGGSPRKTAYSTRQRRWSRSHGRGECRALWRPDIKWVAGARGAHGDVDAAAADAVPSAASPVRFAGSGRVVPWGDPWLRRGVAIEESAVLADLTRARVRPFSHQDQQGGTSAVTTKRHVRPWRLVSRQVRDT